MTPRQRIATRLAFVLISIAGGLLSIALIHATSQASCSTCGANFAGTFYGAQESKVNQAIGGTIWPQTSSNACAIADVVAVVNYDYLTHGLGLRFPNGAEQGYIAQGNQTYGASEWGHATPTNAMGGITNIAPDFGNDPRSVAFDIKKYEWSTIQHHDWIYRWQFAHTTAPSFAQQAKEATTLVARALGYWTAPVVVFINGGLHSVVMTGVWSTNNPDTNFPADIQGLVYRDSEGNATTSRQEISLSTWISGNYSNPFGTYSLWSLYYGDRYAVGGMKNIYDPDPTVGVYTPTSSDPHHWYLGFTWVTRDSTHTDATLNADWAFNAYNGTIMRSP
jgi:hypothetical protein